jgi:hypothetical protein
MPKARSKKASNWPATTDCRDGAGPKSGAVWNKERGKTSAPASTNSPSPSDAKAMDVNSAMGPEPKDVDFASPSAQVNNTHRAKAAGTAAKTCAGRRKIALQT